jgi:hypothetical protein
MATKVKIRSKFLYRELTTNENKEAARQLMEEIGEQEISKSLVKFKEEFEAHPFTQELEEGKDAENTSGSLNGYGNMFSFLGFYASRKNPIEKLRGAIFKSLKVRAKRVLYGRYEIQTNIPTIDELKNNDAHNLTWTNRSWIDAVEQGVSGFGAFFHHEKFSKAKKSRSKRALQIKNLKGPIRDGKFKNASYLTKMYRNFIKNIKKQ